MLFLPGPIRVAMSSTVRLTPYQETAATSPTQAIIYEVDVRDYSMQKEAGFQHPGTFPALLGSPKHGDQAFGFNYLSPWVLLMFNHCPSMISEAWANKSYCFLQLGL